MSTVIEKIKKLLNVTTDKGATEAEAIQALAAAQRLMAKEGLTDADLETGEERTQVTNAAFETKTKGISNLVYDMALMLADHYRVLIYHTLNLKTREKTLRVVGREEDTKIFNQVLCYALAMQDQCFKEFLKERKEKQSLKRAESVLLKNTYCKAFRQGLHVGLTENEECYALALRVSKDVVTYMETELKPTSIKRQGSTIVRDADASAKGFQAGKETSKLKNTITQ